MIHSRLEVEKGHIKAEMARPQRKQESPDIRHQIRAGDTTIAAAPSKKSISDTFHNSGLLKGVVVFQLRFPFFFLFDHFFLAVRGHSHAIH